jgi:hypothetical protein
MQLFYFLLRQAVVITLASWLSQKTVENVLVISNHRYLGVLAEL